jgi:hypothetical protein
MRPYRRWADNAAYEPGACTDMPKLDGISTTDGMTKRGPARTSTSPVSSASRSSVRRMPHRPADPAGRRGRPRDLVWSAGACVRIRRCRRVVPGPRGVLPGARRTRGRCPPRGSSRCTRTRLCVAERDGFAHFPVRSSSSHVATVGCGVTSRQVHYSEQTIAGLDDEVSQGMIAWKIESPLRYARTSRAFRWDPGAPEYDYATFSVTVGRRVSYHLSKFFLL